MFKNVKLAVKIGGGFGILLVFAVAMAFFGIKGLSSVVNRTEKADDVNRIVKMMLTSRQHEKNYIIRKDVKYAEKVDQEISSLIEETEKLSNKFNQQVNKQQAAAIINKAGLYKKAFDLYTEFEGKKNESMAKMRQAASDVLKKAEEGRADQKKQLVIIRKESDKAQQDKIQKSEDANYLIQMLLEAKWQRMAIAEGDRSVLPEWKETVDALIAKATDMKQRFSDAQNIKKIETVISSYEKYRELALKHFDNPSDQALAQRMASGAQSASDVVLEIRQDQKKQLMALMEKTGAQIDDKIMKADASNRMIKLFLDLRKNEKEVIISGENKYKEKVDSLYAEIVKEAEHIRGQFKKQLNIDQVNDLIGSLSAYKRDYDEYMSFVGEQKKAEGEMVSAARDVQKECMDARVDQKNKMKSQITQSNTVVLSAAIVSSIIGIALAFIITLGITKPLNRIIAGLGDGADQTAAASGEVSNSAQQLSQGATEQAAALEESSSSLDEMNSMTQQNADNAAKANQMAQDARSGAEEGASAMTQMRSAMADINESSDNIAKIIKTIEEIAFQTNLLALNAAVEAARAGEHGKGFAVVAEEVRNLAKRSADAAKNTAELIEGSISKAKAGVDIAQKADASINAILENTKKVADVIGEIAAASKEQAEGISQVTNAVSQMDQVTQQNASAAEEAASSSEELASQADSLRGMVTELQQLVGGNSVVVPVSKRIVHNERRQVASAPQPVKYTAPASPSLGGGEKKSDAKVVKPEDVIPFDEDFSDF